jgi:hypothetical protein
VVFHRLLAESGLERFFVDVFTDAEHIIIRAFAHQDDRTETMTYIPRPPADLRFVAGEP